jgi:hypothetical protein
MTNGVFKSVPRWFVGKEVFPTIGVGPTKYAYK